jgi:hypothetical protein
MSRSLPQPAIVRWTFLLLAFVVLETWAAYFIRPTFMVAWHITHLSQLNMRFTQFQVPLRWGPAGILAAGNSSASFVAMNPFRHNHAEIVLLENESQRQMSPQQIAARLHSVDKMLEHTSHISHAEDALVRKLPTLLGEIDCVQDRRLQAAGVQSLKCYGNGVEAYYFGDANQADAESFYSIVQSVRPR